MSESDATEQQADKMQSCAAPRREHPAIAAFVLKWLLLTFPLGLVVGSACAGFLWSLDLVTNIRFQQPWLLWLLPVAGAVVGWKYGTFGPSVEAGNNLIVDEIHEPGGGVPLRMTPLVLIGTLITHLFGGSAGREGTAVQMGGSLASGLARLIPRLSRSDTQIILTAGVAAGFAGVFGTPVAAMIFAIEVLAIGRMDYRAILPCLSASVISDQTCLLFGIVHTHYSVQSFVGPESSSHLAPFDGRLMAAAVLGGILFGLASLLFSELTHGIASLFRMLVKRPLLRPVLGGLIVIGLVQLTGTRDYLGLGVAASDPGGVSIVNAFNDGGAQTWSWFWKIVFTAVTVGSGFKGGEVTPLFFIGATLGNTIAVFLGVPVDLLAALGFVGVFAGATNTPLACMVMAVELFGGEFVLYYAVSCLLAYLFSGHSGIYLSQRIGTSKSGRDHVPEESLRNARQARSERWLNRRKE